MNKNWIALTASLALTAVPAFAQNGGQGGQGQGGQRGKDAPAQGGKEQPGVKRTDGAQTRGQGMFLQRSDKVVGMNVEQQGGQRLGRIDDLVFNADGSIAYAVLAADGGGGMKYPVPWSQLQVTRGVGDKALNGNVSNDRVSAHFDTSKLTGAPNFTGEWPKDRKIFTDADAYYGAGMGSGTAGGAERGDRGRTAEAGAGTSMMTMRASELRNQAVVDASGNAVGTISQVVLDPTDGRVNFVALSLNGAQGAGAKTIAVPWGVFKAAQVNEKNQVQLSVPPATLQNAPEFKSGDDAWKSMSEQAWLDGLYTHYQTKPYWTSRGNAAGDRGAMPKDADKRDAEKRDTDKKDGEKRGDGREQRDGKDPR